MSPHVEPNPITHRSHGSGPEHDSSEHGPTEPGPREFRPIEQGPIARGPMEPGPTRRGATRGGRVRASLLAHWRGHGRTACLAAAAALVVGFGCGGERSSAPGRDEVTATGGPGEPGPGATEPQATESPTTGPSSDDGPAAYDLHEWGVVAISPGRFEIAAGPGRRAVRARLPRLNIQEVTVDKPVLYVHPTTDGAFDLGLEVTLGAGLSVSEHFPPTTIAPLAWQARVEGTCRGDYGGVDDSRCPDGYCEVAELGLYEADGACLAVNGVRAPLLFYRLGARGAGPAMPLSIRRRGDSVTVRNDGLAGQVGDLWRIRWNGQRTVVRRVTAPPVGATVAIAAPGDDVVTARRALRRDLGAHGLTAAETAAFLRGWEASLFGAAAAAEEIDDDLPDPADHTAADPTALDTLSNDESDDQPIPPVPPGPRMRDVLIYWLPASAIDAIAHIEASPAPRHLRRAFLVRHAL